MRARGATNSVVRRRPQPSPKSEFTRRNASEGDSKTKGTDARKIRNARRLLGFGWDESPSARRSSFAAALFVISASCLALSWMFFGGGIEVKGRQRLGSLRGRPSKQTGRRASSLSSTPLTTSAPVLRISSTDHANVTQFFPCISSVLTPNFIGIKDVLPRHRSKARFTPKKYDSLPCAPTLCFRGVYDGFEDLLSDAHKSEKIQLLLESLILHPGVPLSAELTLHWKKTNRSSLLRESTSRKKTYYKVDGAEGARKFGELHADYFESPKYVYTAILYDDTPKDLLGGETALIDWVKDESSGTEEMVFGLKNTTGTASMAKDEQRSKGNKVPTNNEEEPIRLTSGIVVEPKRGRIVLFSSGGENFHAPLSVWRGQRPTHHVWFECNS